MCRLLGYVSRRPISVLEVLGRKHFDAFTALTVVHGDGWGVAWQDPDDLGVRTASSPESADRDPNYVKLTGMPLGRAGIVHLRWATPGLTVRPENTHPFVADGYAFAHNGHIAPVQRLEELLTPESRAQLRGDTDSERYFRFVMQCVLERGDDADGLSQALEVLVREFPESSLNALMMTPTRMFGVHINSQAPAPVKGLRKLFDSEEEIPSRHTDDYFAMDFRVTGDPVGWTQVPEDNAAMVDMTTLEIRRMDGWAPQRTT